MNMKRLFCVLSLAWLTLIAQAISPAAEAAVFLANPVVDNGKIQFSVKLDSQEQFAEALEFFVTFAQDKYTLGPAIAGPNFLPPSFSVIPFEGPQHVGVSCILIDPCPLQSANDDVLLTWTLTPKPGNSGDPGIAVMVSLQGITPDGDFVDPTPAPVPGIPEPAATWLFLTGLAALACFMSRRTTTWPLPVRQD
jgi:hypothetical protein